jgi:hypothetical protein
MDRQLTAASAILPFWKDQIVYAFSRHFGALSAPGQKTEVALTKNEVSSYPNNGQDVGRKKIAHRMLWII